MDFLPSLILLIAVVSFIHAAVPEGFWFVVVNLPSSKGLRLGHSFGEGGYLKNLPCMYPLVLPSCHRRGGRTVTARAGLEQQTPKKGFCCCNSGKKTQLGLSQGSNPCLSLNVLQGHPGHHRKGADSESHSKGTWYIWVPGCQWLWFWYGNVVAIACR